MRVSLLGKRARESAQRAQARKRARRRTARKSETTTRTGLTRWSISGLPLLRRSKACGCRAPTGSAARSSCRQHAAATACETSARALHAPRAFSAAAWRGSHAPPRGVAGRPRARALRAGSFARGAPKRRAWWEMAIGLRLNSRHSSS